MRSEIFSALYFLFFALTLYLRVRGRKKTLKAERIKGRIISAWTTKYIFYGYLIVIFSSLAEYFILRKDINLFISASGIILYTAGILGRKWAGKSLGKYWSVHIEIREKHELIIKGPYKYLRHPNTLFHILEVTGLALIPNSYFSLLVFIVFYLPVWLLRAFIEERAMAIAVGEEYKEYKRKVWAFLPLLLKGK